MARGMRIQIEGLDQMLRGQRNAQEMLDDVMREILRGPLGHAMARELKARTADNSRSGWTVSTIGVEDRGRAGVEVGVTKSKGALKHPNSPRANARAVSTWLESGTRMHYIPTRVTRYNHMAFSGRVVSRVTHPGMRGAHPMRTTIRVYKSDGEALAIRELERRLGPKIGAH